MIEVPLSHVIASLAMHVVELAVIITYIIIRATGDDRA